MKACITKLDAFGSRWPCGFYVIGDSQPPRETFSVHVTPVVEHFRMAAHTSNKSMEWFVTMGVKKAIKLPWGYLFHAAESTWSWIEE